VMEVLVRASPPSCGRHTPRLNGPPRAG
jgi:hypothetical protein